MKAVIIGEPSGASMEQIMAVYPRHKELMDRYVASGDLLGAGPFSDFGNMAIFRSREAAEKFAAEDPFALEGMVKGYTVKDWADELLPG